MIVLHERESQDLHVQLVWNSDTNRVYVRVRDRKSDDVFVIAPDSADALEAFYHPFCYGAAAEAYGRLGDRAGVV